MTYTGSNTPINVGTLGTGVSWSHSIPVGSGDLADRHLRSDPPTAAELDALREEVDAAFGLLEVPQPNLAVSVGGSTASLRRLVGDFLDSVTAGRAIDVLAGGSSVEIAQRYDLHPRRVRVMPAVLVVPRATA